MILILARFINLLLAALAAGVVLSHVMSRARKVTLPAPLFVTVQNVLYRSWGTKGWFALSCGDAVSMGRFHQSHQRPSARIDLRIPSCRLGLAA
jgi:hypothetical protein